MAGSDGSSQAGRAETRGGEEGVSHINPNPLGETAGRLQIETQQRRRTDLGGDLSVSVGSSLRCDPNGGRRLLMMSLMRGSLTGQPFGPGHVNSLLCHE